MKLIHLNQNVENCLRISKMPKNGLKKNRKKISTNVENHQKTVKIQQKHQFSIFFEKKSGFFKPFFLAILNCCHNGLNFG